MSHTLRFHLAAALVLVLGVILPFLIYGQWAVSPGALFIVWISGRLALIGIDRDRKRFQRDERALRRMAYDSSPPEDNERL